MKKTNDLSKKPLQGVRHITQTDLVLAPIGPKSALPAGETLEELPR